MSSDTALSRVISPEQKEQILTWYATGLTPGEIVSIAYKDWNITLTNAEVMEIWRKNQSKVAAIIRNNIRALRENPYYEPAFIVKKISDIALALETRIKEEISNENMGGAIRVIDTWLKLLTKIQEYYGLQSSLDTSINTDWQEVWDSMNEEDKERLTDIMLKANEIIDKYKTS